jgi:hypothetical protein
LTTAPDDAIVVVVVVVMEKRITTADHFSRDESTAHQASRLGRARSGDRGCFARQPASRPHGQAGPDVVDCEGGGAELFGGDQPIRSLVLPDFSLSVSECFM